MLLRIAVSAIASLLHLTIEVPDNGNAIAIASRPPQGLPSLTPALTQFLPTPLIFIISRYH